MQIKWFDTTFTITAILVLNQPRRDRDHDRSSSVLHAVNRRCYISSKSLIFDHSLNSEFFVFGTFEIRINFNWKNNPYWQIPGAWARPISGELIQNRALSDWKSKNDIQRISGRQTDQFLENSVKYGQVFQKSVFVTPQITEISGKILDEFSIFASKV